MTSLTWKKSWPAVRRPVCRPCKNANCFSLGTATDPYCPRCRRAIDEAQARKAGKR